MNFFNAIAMKTKISVIFLLLEFCFSLSMVQAQDRERLEAYKIAFYTKRLDLSASEAQRFWPLYNEYQKKRIEIQQERTKLNRIFNLEGSEMSEAELITAGDKLIELQVKETDLAVNFHKQLKTVLPPRKVIKFYQSENQFRMQLLKQLQERNPEKRNLPPDLN